MNPVVATSLLVAGIFALVPFPPLGVFLMVMAALVMQKARTDARQAFEAECAKVIAKQRREKILAMKSFR